jgi:transposase
MARAYSEDLRERVIGAALGGLSERRAAARYGGGISTAVVWVRRARQTGKMAACRKGQLDDSKLDPPAGFLLELIGAPCHISLNEMQALLQQERGVSAGIGTLWRFFRTRAITVKKPLTQPSRTGRTSLLHERPGLRVSSILILSGRCSSTRPVPRPRWHACMAAAPPDSAYARAFPTAMCGRPLRYKKNLVTGAARLIGCCHVSGL